MSAGLPESAAPIFARRSDRNKPVPYVVVRYLTMNTTHANDFTQQEGRLEFRCRASEADQANDIAQLVHAWVIQKVIEQGLQVERGRSFFWDKGAAGSTKLRDWTQDVDRFLGHEGKPIYYDLLSYTCFVKGEP